LKEWELHRARWTAGVELPGSQALASVTVPSRNARGVMRADKEVVGVSEEKLFDLSLVPLVSVAIREGLRYSIRALVPPAVAFRGQKDEKQAQTLQFCSLTNSLTLLSYSGTDGQGEHLLVSRLFFRPVKTVGN